MSADRGARHGSRPVVSEARNQSLIRQFYAEQGCRLWRNQVGVLKDITGRPVRFGLANDSKQVNDEIKSGDLIGWRPRLVTPEMVGGVFAQFVSIEAKPDGWVFPNPTNLKAYAHASAQARWARMVRADGGEAGFMIDPTRGFEPL